MPLIHPPGHAQADFGEARAVIGGVARKVHFFVFDLPHSDACYVRAYPAATAEAWIDGHVHAFAFSGGVPQSVLYDNDREQYLYSVRRWSHRPEPELGTRHSRKHRGQVWDKKPP